MLITELQGAPPLEEIVKQIYIINKKLDEEITKIQFQINYNLQGNNQDSYLERVGDLITKTVCEITGFQRGAGFIVIVDNDTFNYRYSGQYGLPEEQKKELKEDLEQGFEGLARHIKGVLRTGKILDLINNEEYIQKIQEEYQLKPTFLKEMEEFYNQKIEKNNPSVKIFQNFSEYIKGLYVPILIDKETFRRVYKKNLDPKIDITQKIIPAIGAYIFDIQKNTDPNLLTSEYTKNITQMIVNKITTSIMLSAKIDETLKAYSELDAIKEREKLLQLISATKALNLGIKHELNQSISILNTQLLMLLKDELIGQIIKNEDRYKNIILQITKSIKEITEKVSHIKETEEQMKTETINLKTIIDECTRQYKQDLTINVNTPNELYVNWNREIAEMVINNLLKNAYEALQSKEKKIIDIVAKSTNGNIYLRIKDYGIGMDEKTKKDAFIPGKSTKGVSTDSKHRGYGLYAVLKAIIAANGDITLDSKQGEYTEIKITLPKTKKINSEKDYKIQKN
ncbi:MAG: sensor histidine kinase [Candidatus Woesearchaeota archaeon]